MALRDHPEHPVLRYHLLYPLYLFVIFKDIVVGKAQLRKQLRGDVTVLKHRTAFVALLILSERRSGRADHADLLDEFARGRMTLDADDVDLVERSLNMNRRTFRDYFTETDDTDDSPSLQRAVQSLTESSTAQRPDHRLGAESGVDESESENEFLLPWAKKTMDLLNVAESRSLFRTEDAFRSYFEARRLLLYGLSALDDEAVQTRARSVLNRARSVPDPHVRTAVEELLTANGTLRESLHIQTVLEANEILHTHYLDVYRQMESIRLNMFSFVLTAVSAIVLIVFLLPTADLVSTTPDRIISLSTDRGFLVLVMMFGVMGSSLSGLLSVSKGSDGTHRLEQVMGSWLALVRATVGAASSLLVFFFLLVPGFLVQNALSVPLVLGVSFVAGFSERLLLRIIGAIDSSGPIGK